MVRASPALGAGRERLTRRLSIFPALREEINETPAHAGNGGLKLDGVIDTKPSYYFQPVHTVPTTLLKIRKDDAE